MTINDAEHYLHHSLKCLMQLKSIKDNKKFTIYQLAKALQMPHSMLVKLLHVDPIKRVNNPRIDTLSKIVDYFREDGFNVTIDDFISGNVTKTSVDVSSQYLSSPQILKSISVFSLDGDMSTSLGKIDINLTHNSDSLVALLSDRDIKPIFKKGSIFIVDTNIRPEEDTLVVVQDDNSNRLIIRKIHIQGSKQFLISFDVKKPSIELDQAKGYKLIGVIVQVDAKT